jgi:hypothetical protein
LRVDDGKEGRKEKNDRQKKEIMPTDGRLITSVLFISSF